LHGRGATGLNDEDNDEDDDSIEIMMKMMIILMTSFALQNVVKI